MIIIFKVVFIIFVVSISFLFFNHVRSEGCDHSRKLSSGGSAGTISVRNDTTKTLRVTYSGLGCDGIGFGLASVCAWGILEPNQISHHDYGWGVTTTWINIAGNSSPGPASACGLASNMPTYRDYCFIDHQVVDTDANETDDCAFTNDNGANKLTCKRK